LEEILLDIAQSNIYLKVEPFTEQWDWIKFHAPGNTGSTFKQ